MKKIMGAVLLILMGMSCPVGATSQYSGVYVGFMAGANMTKAKVDRPSVVFQPQVKAQQDDTQPNFDAALGLKMGNIRLAAEMTFNSKADVGEYQYEHKMYSAQLYYELPVRAIVRPFLNVGIGKFDATIRANPGISKSVSGTAWDVGGGLAFAVTRRINFDIGYRYTDMGDDKFQDSENRDVPFKINQHLLYVGLRYIF